MEQKMLMNPDFPGMGSYMIIEKNIRKGEKYPLHWHDFFEYEIILSGCAEHIHSQSRELLKAGSAYLMSYYDFHSFCALQDTRLFSIQFRDYAVDEEIAGFLSFGVRRLSCAYTEEETARIEEKIRILKEEQKREQPFCRQLTESILGELVIDLIRRSDSGKEHAMPQLIQKAVTYLFLHFRDDVSLLSVSQELHVSVNYLGALFCKSIGVSFREYLNMLRLKYACRLLLSSDLSVKEIAYASGYQTNEHFLRLFKKQLHMTPSEYKQNGHPA